MFNGATNFYNLNNENFHDFLMEMYRKIDLLDKDTNYIRNHLIDELRKELRKIIVNGELVVDIESVVDDFLRNGLSENKVITGIKKKLAECTSQLDTKANEIKSLNDNKMDKNTKDISVTQINKNLGKLDETYMSESLLAKMTGEGTFGTVPEDKSITSIKLASKSIKANNTDFISTKNNDLLLNIQFVYNKYVSYLDGALYDSNTYKSTDFVPVSPGQKLVTNQSNHVAYYNSSKVFLSGLEGGTWKGSLVVPYGVSFIRLTYTNNVNTYLYEVGEDNLYSLETLIPNTEMEKLIKRLSATSNNAIPVVKDIYKLIYESNNLIDYDTLIKGGYYTKDGWQESSDYNSSIFLKVDSLSTYVSNESNIVVMYDKDLLPIKQLWGSSEWESNGKFTTTENTKYITINYRATNKQPFLFKEGVQTTTRYINTSFIDLLINSLVEKNKRLKLKSIEPFNVVKD